MGRKKKEKDEKKVTVSIRIPNDLFASLADIKNKSKFIEWLLTEHFNTVKPN